MDVLPRPVAPRNVARPSRVRPRPGRIIEEVVSAARQVEVAARPDTQPRPFPLVPVATAAMLTFIVPARLPRLTALAAAQEEVDARAVAAPVAVTEYAASVRRPTRLEARRNTAKRPAARNHRQLLADMLPVKQVAELEEEAQLL